MNANLEQNYKAWSRRMGTELILSEGSADRREAMVNKYGYNPESREAALFIVVRNHFKSLEWSERSLTPLAAIVAKVAYRLMYRPNDTGDNIKDELGMVMKNHVDNEEVINLALGNYSTLIKTVAKMVHKRNMEYDAMNHSVGKEIAHTILRARGLR